ncbi:Macrolide export ATP-binding/permease protein macB [Fibrella aestuarina BUZ 2]|uniref:Macrolide export ATP-binding/permease protein macB n=1 Tax=Fibrella aestuarina BUZ 2 TaxID=1166018 RepID=I0K235_9BACT|nr:ABC transporter permease [Fibrella aestuarina]CCG98188.1 Macrolide export ATP-binding/permease protein macB [Fibrella aestuarina BUZ 2]
MKTPKPNYRASQSTPPRWVRWLLRRLHPTDTLEEVEGDLDELYADWQARAGRTQATLRYVLNVASVLPPFVRRRQRTRPEYPNPTPTTMLRNYLTVALRTLVKHKAYSAINIGGLAVGMAVAMLIGLWVYDELSVNRSFQHHDRIAQVVRNRTVNGDTDTKMGLPIPLAQSLKTTYGNSFKHVELAWWTSWHTITLQNQVFSKSGKFITPGAPEMLSLTMLRGSRAGLTEPASILLSASLARALFGDTDPLHKTLTLDNTMTVNVTGVYEDIPAGNAFDDVQFMAPWSLYAASTPWVNEAKDDWTNTSFEVFVELAPRATFADVSARIRHLLAQHTQTSATQKPEVLLYPMARWHLYSDWKNGVNEGGRIQFVWLFGIIGVFVLLLACINFMNLSTARSVNRAKEVGIRKAIGSGRTELIVQFLGESLLVVTLAYGVALLLVNLAVPFFNQIADKHMAIPLRSPMFWLLGIGFTLLTGLISGSYPALYLSSFRPIAVLKGAATTRHLRGINRIATPRRVLVVVQFTVSITLIIGTLVVYRQIQFAKNRPIGYSRNGLISLLLNVPNYEQHRETVRNELIRSGAVLDVGESASPLTEVRSTNGGFEWAGKDPTLQVNFATISVSHEFGKTVGWQFAQGRDFSRQLASDSLGIVLNESAVAFIGLKNVLGKTITWDGNGFNVSFHVIGVIRDMVMDSPYEPAKPSVFFIGPQPGKFLTMRLNPARSPQAALTTIGDVLKEHLPEAPFNYTFVDDEYDQKFRSEERIGTLASVFAGLAIFISCLGLFGLASFVAEQRTKEIGIRKVLGASVVTVWALLSKDFVVLVSIALGIATVIAHYLLQRWLQHYEYRTELSWWIFALAGVGAVVITLLTVSFQAIKAALLDPVKSLRSE